MFVLIYLGLHLNGIADLKALTSFNKYSYPLNFRRKLLYERFLSRLENDIIKY